jgi:hypothetical protein
MADLKNAAPYKIEKRGDKWHVLNNMGESKASFDSKIAARNYQKALYANVKGAPKQAEKKSFTGKQKRPVKASGMSSLEKILKLTDGEPSDPKDHKFKPKGGGGEDKADCQTCGKSADAHSDDSDEKVAASASEYFGEGPLTKVLRLTEES